MAKGDTQSTTTTKPAEPQTSQLPQQNQYLTGNPNTESDANTRWMNPSDASANTGINGGGGAQQAQGIPLQNGTMLGQITAGQVGQYMSPAWNADKFNDPNKHDPKYDIGRILSKYPPGQEGLNAARNELAQAGYQVVGKDKIQGPAGLIDVGFSFSDPNAQHSWQWNPVVDTFNQQNPMMGNSMLGYQPQNQAQNLIQMFQQMLARRQQFANQQFNPTGGQVSQPTQFGAPPGGYAGGIGQGSMLNPSPIVNKAPEGWNMFGPTPDANGLYGGWRDENGIRHPGNQPGMSYLS